MNDKETITPACEQNGDDVEDGEIETDDENGTDETENVIDEDVDDGDGGITNVTSTPSTTKKSALTSPQSFLVSTATSTTKQINNHINNINKKDGRKNSKKRESINNAKATSSTVDDDDWMGNETPPPPPPHPKLHSSSRGDAANNVSGNTSLIDTSNPYEKIFRRSRNRKRHCSYERDREQHIKPRKVSIQLLNYIKALLIYN